MAYARFFMPLVHETKGYDFKGRQPAGRCILESRMGAGKLSVLVQDLKPEVKYGVYLIFAEERRHVGLAIGGLNVAANGKGEFKRDISQEELHNFALAEVVAVAVLDEKATSVASPLCGYRESEVPWRHSFRVWEKPVPIVQEIAAVEPKVTEPEPLVLASEPEEVPLPMPNVEIVMPEQEMIAPEIQPLPEAEQLPEPEPSHNVEIDEQTVENSIYIPIESPPPRATRPPGAQNPPEKISPPLATMPQE